MSMRGTLKCLSGTLIVAMGMLAVVPAAHAATVAGTVDTIDLAQNKVTIKQGNGTSITLGVKGFTKAGIRKLISRLHEELALYEASEEARQPVSK